MAGELAHEGPLDVRRAGVLLHITSLPSTGNAADGSIGRATSGAEAYRFVDFLAAAGFTVWQVLPLVPTHEEDRVAVQRALGDGRQPRADQRARQAERGSRRAGDAHPTQRRVRAWCEGAGDWLEPYVEFIALRDCSTARRGRPGSRAAGP